MHLFSNFCPQCGKGLIYNRLLGKMNKACSHCGRIFEREPGYFTGAMFLDCIFLPVSAIPTVIVLAYNDEIF